MRLSSRRIQRSFLCFDLIEDEPIVLSFDLLSLLVVLNYIVESVDGVRLALVLEPILQQLANFGQSWQALLVDDGE